MLSLVIALLRSYTTLNFWQLMVTCMSLDITSATVQIAISQKEALASRWWVVLNAVSQLAVQATLGTVMKSSFPLSSAQQDPCQTCARAIWWGVFDSCKAVPWTFWNYSKVRALLTLRSCAISLHHMHFFDLSERAAKGEKQVDSVSWENQYLRIFTFTDPTKIVVWNLKAFPKMPATSFTD